jgi:NAD(P)H-hydrate epimerase
VLPVFTGDEMRQVDRRAIEELGIPGATLMENAGRGAAEAILAVYPELSRGRRAVTIVCGKGGNGGDGFVVARHLRRRGVDVHVLLTTPPREISGDAGLKLAALRRARVRPVPIDDVDVAAAALAGSTLIVDALLGTGFRGPATGVVARMIEAINASGRPVVALDIPSGLSADGGQPDGPAIRATLTVTFAGLKRALCGSPGLDRAGSVVTVPIGVPEAEVGRGITTFLLEREDIARHFPERPREAHKGTYGRLLIVAGSRGKTGAAALAARAAMRSGAGLVTAATAESQQAIVAALVLEAMTEPLPETPARTIGLAALEPVTKLAGDRDAVAIGPGLGLEAETLTLARTLAQDLTCPMAIDADALTALAGHVPLLRTARGPRCLTPHPGEMARLVGATVADVQRDRIAVTRDLATRAGVHVVLKGATSVIGSPDGRVVLNPTGNPGMASGGTGDVLTGILGAFLARRLAPDVALACAVYLHGAAGDAAARRVGQEALVASDVIEGLPEAFASLQATPGASRGRPRRSRT